MTRKYPIRPKLVYLASCYRSARGNHGTDLYVAEAKVWCRRLYKAGVKPWSPVIETHNFDGMDMPPWLWQLGDFVILDRCDAIVMHPNAADSRGAQIERKRMLAQGKPAFYMPQDWGKLCAWAKKGAEPMAKAVESKHPDVDWLRAAGYNMVAEEERQ